MRSPFPGMDPYLESPAIWPDLHDRLATEISIQLNRVLPQPYYARMQMRPEIGIATEGVRGSRILPDVAVVKASAADSTPGSVAVLEGPRVDVSRSLNVKIFREPLRHHFVEIRDSRHDHALVTLIEIVSPSNKRRGVDRDSYERKQQEVLHSDANLVEIDLLRTGDRIYANLFLADFVGQIEPPPDYVVLVNRAFRRADREFDYEVFPIGLRDILPCVGMPLRPHVAEVPLDLQYVFDRVYEGGPYVRGAVDYGQPPEPDVQPADAEWVRERVAAAFSPKASSA